MKTQKKLLINNAYSQLKEMGVDVGEIKKRRAIDINRAQQTLESEQRSVTCPFCSRKFNLVEGEFRLGIVSHIESSHDADIKH